MKFFKFDLQSGKNVTHHHSNFFINPFVHLDNESKIALAHLKKNGLIGYHQATVPQLFIVLEGEGYVRGDDSKFLKICAGEAVLWTAGEWHEAKSENGLLGIVIESKELNNHHILLESKFGLQH